MSIYTGFKGLKYFFIFPFERFQNFFLYVRVPSIIRQLGRFQDSCLQRMMVESRFPTKTRDGFRIPSDLRLALFSVDLNHVGTPGGGRTQETDKTARDLREELRICIAELL